MARSPTGIEAGAAFVRVSLENKDFRAGLHTTSRLMNRYGAMLAKVGAVGVGVGSALVGSFAILTKQVANLETQFKRFDLIFKDMSASIRSELKAISGETGVPMSSLVKEASTFGAVFAEMRDDLSDDQFTKVIGNTMKAMLNLAAIGGISLEEAAERLKSGFTSTGESVDQFGFNLRKTALEAEAARLGFKKSVLTMSEQEKQLLKLNIFMRQSTRTGISFVSMVDTINGQLTLMRANLTELVYRAGWTIRRAVTPLLKAFNHLLIALRPLATVLSPFITVLASLSPMILSTGAFLAALGVAGQAYGFIAGGLAKIGLDLKTFHTFLVLLPSLAAKARTAILGMGAAIAAMSRSLWGLVLMLPLFLQMLKALPAALLSLAAAHPILLGIGTALGIKAADSALQAKAAGTKRIPYLDSAIEHIMPMGVNPRIAGKGLRNWLFGSPTTPDAAAAGSNALAFSTAGAFGGNIAQRLAFGPAGAGTTAETNSILNMMAEKMGMVTDGDRVKVTNAVD
jgi:hypothetical protein